MKKVKSLKIILLTFILLITGMFASLTVYAEENTCGENLTWEFDESTGTLTVKGTGLMESYTHYSKRPWSSTSLITKVVLEEGITSVGMKAFGQFSNLETIELPSTLETINPFAFYECEKLSNITIPNSVTFIGQEAFFGTPIYADESNYDNGVLYYNEFLLDYDAEKKTEFTSTYSVKEGTKIIASESFVGSGFNEIIIPDSVIDIGYSTFENCASLRKVKLSKNMTEIRSYVFDHCSSLNDITIPVGITSIGSQAFDHCESLTSISLPNTVTHIGSDAFSYCFNLTSIYLPESIESVGRDAFPSTSVYYSGSQADWSNIEFKDPDLVNNLTITYDYKTQTVTDTYDENSDEYADSSDSSSESSKNKEKSSNSGILIAVVVVILVILIGGIAVFLFIKKKNRKSY